MSKKRFLKNSITANNMAENPVDTLSPTQRKRTLGIIFLPLFLDLVGFSIIFPLFPAMLDYYLPHGANDNSFLGQLIQPLVTLAESSGAKDPRFMTTVLLAVFSDRSTHFFSLYLIPSGAHTPIVWGAARCC